MIIDKICVHSYPNRKIMGMRERLLRLQGFVGFNGPTAIASLRTSLFKTRNTGQVVPLKYAANLSIRTGASRTGGAKESQDRCMLIATAKCIGPESLPIRRVPSLKRAANRRGGVRPAGIRGAETIGARISLAGGAFPRAPTKKPFTLVFRGRQMSPYLTSRQNF